LLGGKGGEERAGIGGTLQTDKFFGVDDPSNRAADFHFHRGGHERADDARVGGQNVDELLARLACLANQP
jgi:hypothetical protein